jgi:hypothetical protein
LFVTPLLVGSSLSTPFGIHQQFPKPIEDKRRKLYPVLKDAKRQGKHAVLVRDKLFINGSQYFVDDTNGYSYWYLTYDMHQ